MSYLDLGLHRGPRRARAHLRGCWCEEERNILTMEQKYRDKAKDVDKIREKVAAAHEAHQSYLSQ